MRLVVDTLDAKGHNAYCNRFDEIVDKLQAKDDVKGIFNEAFKSAVQCAVEKGLLLGEVSY